MADNTLTTSGRPNSPHISDAAETTAQEARVKRAKKTKKIDLKAFAGLSGSKRLKDLNSLIKAGKGPLRLWKEEVGGEQVLYLRPRTWGQYFYETLFLFPAEQETRCDKVRAAIQMYIRPYLDAQMTTTVMTQNPGENRTAALLNTERMAILDRLDCRVYTDQIDPASFFGSKPSHVLDKKRKRDANIFSQEMRRAYHGMTTVPKGLSIARIAPFKVTADVRILTKVTHILADRLPIPGENCSPSAQWACPEEKQFRYRARLRDYYMGMLEAYGRNMRTMVLEVGDDGDDHWLSAYDAANQWLADQPEHDKPAIMLVPLYRADDFLPSRHGKAHNQGWSALMAKKLEMEDVRIPNQASNSSAPPVTSNASVISQGKLRDGSLESISETSSGNDNDNDSSKYHIVN